jgi:hypothetical protein
VLDRRRLLAGGLALAAPGRGWAAAGAPAFLAAAREPDGRFALHGLGADGASRFAIALPDRGHAAAAHPGRPEAVCFARRPGTFALVIDCAAGREARRLETPAGLHFMGHGAFSADGGRLFTTENAYETGEGRIGVWDAAGGYARIGAFASGGVGPHEALLSADGAALIVANGGIRTHPDSGRAKLNLAAMRPNLTALSAADGALLAAVEPEPPLRLNSLRHLATRPDGLIAVAAQWEGEAVEGEADVAPPLLALWRPGAPALRWLPTPGRAPAARYAGSVAFSGDGRAVAITFPRDGFAEIWAADAGAPLGVVTRADVCGVAPAEGGLLLTDGLGGLTLAAVTADGVATRALAAAPCAWDNHLVLAPRA